MKTPELHQADDLLRRFADAIVDEMQEGR